MAKSSILQRYARIGAAARIKEIQDEIASISKAFTDLGGHAPAARRKRRRKTATAPAPAPKPEAQPGPEKPAKSKRRKMSAAARKAIGDAQRRRWAEQKAQAKN